MHNKWINNIAPAVYWFDDRLEIVSNGGIPKNLTKEEFLSGKTEPVNKELMKIFLQCGIVEHSGHGVPIVVREYGEQAYKFSENMITVVIPFNKMVLNKKRNGTVKNAIYEQIKINSNITILKLVEIIGKSERTIKREIAKLKKEGIIERVGSDKTGYWKIIK